MDTFLENFTQNFLAPTHALFCDVAATTLDEKLFSYSIYFN